MKPSVDNPCKSLEAEHPDDYDGTGSSLNSRGCLVAKSEHSYNTDTSKHFVDIMNTSDIPVSIAK